MSMRGRHHPILMATAETRAALVLERCDTLAACSEEPDRLTRRFATPALREAGELVAGWMRDAALDVRRDAVGNVVGARACGHPHRLAPRRRRPAARARLAPRHRARRRPLRRGARRARGAGLRRG